MEKIRFTQKPISAIIPLEKNQIFMGDVDAIFIEEGVGNAMPKMIARTGDIITRDSPQSPTLRESPNTMS